MIKLFYWLLEKGHDHTDTWVIYFLLLKP